MSISALMMVCAGLLVIPGAMAVTESGSLIQGPRFHSELAAVDTLLPKPDAYKGMVFSP